MKSFKKVKTPVIIAGVQATVSTDGVEYDIPLLFSKVKKKKAKIQGDFPEDKIHTFSKKVKIYFTSTGENVFQSKNIVPGIQFNNK